MGACRQEHADRSMPMGWCDQKGEGEEIMCFLSVYSLNTCTGIEMSRREHADGNMWIRTCGWECGDGSIGTGAIFF